MKSKALVVLSGGQDSATCMAWAAHRFDEIMAVSFNYNQRHSKELESAKKIAELFGCKHKVVDMAALMGLKGSGLTSQDVSVMDTDEDTGLPKSFVPGRNILFLAAASSLALSEGITDLVTGVCQTDYSGYPDCRRSTIDSMEQSIYLGNQEVVDKLCEKRAIKAAFKIHTPLMNLSKAETVKLADELPLGLEAVALSWTCYQGGEQPCGECPACKLRIKGFSEAGIDDPALGSKSESVNESHGHENDQDSEPPVDQGQFGAAEV